MQLIASGLRHHVDYAAASASKLSALVACQHLEFPDRIHPQHEAGGAPRSPKSRHAVDVGPVQQPGGLVRPRACHRNPGTVALGGDRIGIANRIDPRYHERKLTEVSPVQGKLQNALFLNHSRHRAGAGVHQRRFARHRHLLRYRPDLHRQRESRFLPHHKGNSCSHQSLETGERCRHLVRSRGKLCHDEIAFFIRRCRALNACVRVGYDNVSAGIVLGCCRFGTCNNGYAPKHALYTNGEARGTQWARSANR